MTALGVEEISASSVSKITKELDEKVEEGMESEFYIIKAHYPFIDPNALIIDRNKVNKLETDDGLRIDDFWKVRWFIIKQKKIV